MLNALTALIPSPLHPAVVHLPIAFALLTPIFAGGALVAARRGVKPVRAWSLSAAMFLALTASAWVAIETGENEEDRVERVVSEGTLDTHERAADQFLWLSAALAAVAAGGLLSGRMGASARVLATVGSVLLLPAGYRVGHSGGTLVYTHNAASAYSTGAPRGGGDRGNDGNSTRPSPDISEPRTERDDAR